MNINKDEACILAKALSEAKYDMAAKYRNEHPTYFANLTKLENRLEDFSQDKRKCGRTSNDTWEDLIKRLDIKTKTGGY